MRASGSCQTCSGRRVVNFWQKSNPRLTLRGFLQLKRTTTVIYFSCEANEKTPGNGTCYLFVTSPGRAVIKERNKNNWIKFSTTAIHIFVFRWRNYLPNLCMLCMLCYGSYVETFGKNATAYAQHIPSLLNLMLTRIEEVPNGVSVMCMTREVRITVRGGHH